MPVLQVLRMLALSGYNIYIDYKVMHASTDVSGVASLTFGIDRYIEECQE